MRTGVGVGVRVEVVVGFFRRVRVSLSGGREVEERRRWAESRRVKILVEEAVERESDGLERVEICGMGFGEGETLSYGFVEEGAAVTAERHHRQIIELGGAAPH